MSSGHEQNLESASDSKAAREQRLSLPSVSHLLRASLPPFLSLPTPKRGPAARDVLSATQRLRERGREEEERGRKMPDFCLVFTAGLQCLCYFFHPWH